MFVDRLIDSYVTVLSLVHVENILFDAACGLLISPRNEGIIRYYGRERENSKKNWVKTYVPKWIIMTTYAGRLRP